jgi:hypothetical protein
VVLDPDGIIRHYVYNKRDMKEAVRVAELLRREGGEVVENAEVGRETELGEAELVEKRKAGEVEYGEKRGMGYEIMTKLNGMEEEGTEKRYQMGPENWEERREMGEATENVEKEYEDREEEPEFVKTVKVWEYWEEETMHEEENIREENMEEHLYFAEDTTKYRQNGDHSHSTAGPQDYEEMVLGIQVFIYFHDSSDERIKYPDGGTKLPRQTYEVVKEEEESTGVEKRVAGDTRGTEESVPEMEKMGEWKMDERGEMGEARKDVEVETFGYTETEEKVESILEAVKAGLEETRYMDIHTGEAHLNEKRLITETTLEHTVSGGYAHEALHTYRAGQYVPRGPEGTDPLGYATKEDVEYPGLAVKLSNQEKGERVNTDVGDRGAEETREVGREIEGKQKAGVEKVKEKLVRTEVKIQEGAGMGHMEVKEGKRMGEERMQDREKVGKEEEKGWREVGKEGTVTEKCVDREVEKEVGENMEVPHVSTTYVEDKVGDKNLKGKCKLPDDKMKYGLKGDHAQDTKERPQGSSYIELKLDGIIRVYHYTGRHMKYPGNAAKHGKTS